MSEFGHIKISRKAYATDHFWNEERVFSKWEAWEWMIQAAAWKDHRRVVGMNVIELKRGEFLASVRFLAEAWGWKKDRVHEFLRLLIDIDRISRQRGTASGAVYLLKKYDTYQSATENEPTQNQTGSRQVADSEPTASRQSRSSKAGKEGKAVVGQSVSQSVGASEETENDRVTAAIRAANAGMIDNPRLGDGAFTPIDPADEDARRTAAAWIAAGISPPSIVEEVYYGAAGYRPRSDRPQIERLGYFERPIRKRHELDTSRHVERPQSTSRAAATTPRKDTEAANVHTESPGSGRRYEPPRPNTPPEALADILAQLKVRGLTHFESKANVAYSGRNDGSRHG